MGEDGREILSSRGWLATTPADFRRAILAEGRIHRVAPGEVFSKAGESDAPMWGVISGQALLTSAMNGPDATPGLLLHPGQWGGYMPLFRQPRAANGSATIESLMLMLPIRRVRRLLAETPRWWEHIAYLTHFAGVGYATLAVDQTIKASDRRVAAILLSQAGCRRAGLPAPLNLSQVTIGEMAHLSRHPVGAILATFAARGWIECGYGVIRILNAGAMRKLADGG
jgi:CRP-like cAMP-binding protein